MNEYECQSATQAIELLTQALRHLGAPDSDNNHEPGLSEHTRAIEQPIRAVRRYLRTERS